MTRVLSLTACTCALTILAARADAQAPATSIRDAIVAQERAWSEALIRHDADSVARVIGDDYVGIDGRGVVTTKAEEIAEAKGPAGSSSGPAIVREELTDVRVRLYGETAVLTAINTQYALTQGVESAVTRFRRTTIWIRRDNRWQCVSFHGSRILTPVGR